MEAGNGESTEEHRVGFADGVDGSLYSCYFVSCYDFLYQFLCFIDMVYTLIRINIGQELFSDS